MSSCSMTLTAPNSEFCLLQGHQASHIQIPSADTEQQSAVPILSCHDLPLKVPQAVRSSRFPELRTLQLRARACGIPWYLYILQCFLYAQQVVGQERDRGNEKRRKQREKSDSCKYLRYATERSRQCRAAEDIEDFEMRGALKSLTPTTKPATDIGVFHFNSLYKPQCIPQRDQILGEQEKEDLRERISAIRHNGKATCKIVDISDIPELDMRCLQFAYCFQWCRATTWAVEFRGDYYIRDFDGEWFCLDKGLKKYRTCVKGDDYMTILFYRGEITGKWLEIHITERPELKIRFV